MTFDIIRLSYLITIQKSVFLYKTWFSKLLVNRLILIIIITYYTYYYYYLLLLLLIRI